MAPAGGPPARIASATDNDGRRSLARRAFGPRPEALEDRTVLSTFPVLNGADSGPGSLRQAVLAANAASGADTIVFAKTVHKVTLTSGELLITGGLTIAGPGANTLTVSGDDASRVFHIQAGTAATIAGITISDGLANSSAPGLPSTGGAILNQGSLTLNADVLADNRAVGDPAVIVPANAVFQIAGGALGGAIGNFGTMLSVTGCTFNDNQALAADGPPVAPSPAMASGAPSPISVRPASPTAGSPTTSPRPAAAGSAPMPRSAAGGRSTTMPR